MKKTRRAQEITRFGRAAFRITAADVRNAELLDEALARVIGSLSTTPGGDCTVFTCNLYAPPVPPPPPVTTELD